MAPGGGGTHSGKTLESMIEAALISNKYIFTSQTHIGPRPGGSKFIVDFVVAGKTKEGLLLVSLKWQEVSGTAEEKIPYEMISLINAKRLNPDFIAGYVILGGGGFKSTYKEWLLSGGVNEYLTDTIVVLDSYDFIRLINRNEV